MMGVFDYLSVLDRVPVHGHHLDDRSQTLILRTFIGPWGVVIVIPHIDEDPGQAVLTMMVSSCLEMSSLFRASVVVIIPAIYKPVHLIIQTIVHNVQHTNL